MKKEIYYEKRKSAKNEKEYLVLVVNVGYREVVISYDTATIVELSGLSYQEVNSLQVGDKKIIGYLGE